MKAFEAYVSELEALVYRIASQSKSTASDQLRIHAALDGEPSAKLREMIPIRILRDNGAFFTNTKLAKKLIATIQNQLVDGAFVTDLACGTGNLLTACAYHLPITGNVDDTLELWGKYLAGMDLFDEFIRATKARLALVALERGTNSSSGKICLEEAFPQIKIGDAFEQTELVAKAECIPLNPPFTTTSASSDCEWATGKVSTAAVMLERCVRHAKSGAQIVAILPEVLRTGSHYLRWRRTIESMARVQSVEVVGLFDAWTDVDVFILRLTVGQSHDKPTDDWWRSNQKIKVRDTRVADLFDVRVGPVVPYRDPHLGKWYPYIHAHELPVWKAVHVDDSFSHRRFLGTTFVPPFVVLRRTSRPGDKHRAVATVIRGKRAVAVENHLVVLKPKHDSLKLCMDALEKLRHSDTSVWLNERIRCRHLTVSSIGEIPWWK